LPSDARAAAQARTSNVNQTKDRADLALVPSLDAQLAPHREQYEWAPAMESDCSATRYFWALASSAFPSASDSPSVSVLHSRSITARRTGAVSPRSSTKRASMIICISNLRVDVDPL
jgi:hypothetical protein